MRLVLNWTKHRSHERSHWQHARVYFDPLSGLETLVGWASAVTSYSSQGLGDLQVLLGRDLDVSLITLHHRDRLTEPLHQHGVVSRAIQFRLRVGTTEQFDVEKLWRLHPVESHARDRLLNLAGADLVPRRRGRLLWRTPEDVPRCLIVVETEDGIDGGIPFGRLEDLLTTTLQGVPHRHPRDHRRTRPSRLEHPPDEIIVDQWSCSIVDRDMSATFGHRFQGSKDRLPSFTTATLHHRPPEKAQLGSVPISKALEVVGRSGDDDGVDFITFGEGLDRAKQHRTSTEVGGEFVTRTKAMSGSCGGNDDGDSHG